MPSIVARALLLIYFSNVLGFRAKVAKKNWRIKKSSKIPCKVCGVPDLCGTIGPSRYAVLFTL